MSENPFPSNYEQDVRGEDNSADPVNLRDYLRRFFIPTQAVLPTYNDSDYQPKQYSSDHRSDANVKSKNIDRYYQHGGQPDDDKDSQSKKKPATEVLTKLLA